MRVEWLFNGKSIPQGHRFRTTYDFGFVALDILYAYPEDSGTYTCRAINALGETSSTSNLVVQGKFFFFNKITTHRSGGGRVLFNHP